MADRIEREIEEILERLDNELPGGALPEEKKPISLMQRRQQVASQKAARAPRTRSNPVGGVTPTTLLFVGAALTVGGFLASSFAGALIWVAFAGVVLFIAAFIWSLTRTTTAGSRSSGYSPPSGVFWRDRYIEYDPPTPSAWQRLKRRLRR
jgi:hypothetical protein